ncbi:hypothetical protein QAD02_017029, partial [Eretmocerus hayati]
LPPPCKMECRRTYLVLMAIVVLQSVLSLENIPKAVIGGLYGDDVLIRKAFSLAVRTMNECAFDHEFCDYMSPCSNDIDCSLFHRVQFAALMMQNDRDLIKSFKKVREMTGHDTHEIYNNDYGLAAVFGPNDQLCSKFVQGLLELHDLPNIITRPDIHHDRFKSINLHPDLKTLSNIYVEILKKFNWTSFSVLYQKTEHFLALAEVLKSYGPYSYPVYAFHLGGGPNYSEPLLLAKEKSLKNIILDCSYENLVEILKQIQEVGMMTEPYKYIITNLNLQAIDLRAYQYSGVNISGIRLVDLSNHFVGKFLESHLEDLGIDEVKQVRTEDALMFDAVALFAHAYKDLTYGYTISGSKLPHGYEKSDPWSYGLSLRNYISFNTINGLTGPVMLDSDGSRRRFKLDILNLHDNGLKQIGTWDPDEGFDELRLMNELKMTHFNVLITLTAPYAMKVNFSKSLEGNDRYEGFVIDIIKELSKVLNFNYTFHVQDLNNNGQCQVDALGKCHCDGMMDKILKGEMDLAITDLTITEERERCVDFSTPFWNLGMGILYKKPTKEPPTYLSFLLPFHLRVWMFLAGIYVLVSVLFFVLGRLSPGEWNNPYPCIEEPSELHNQFTLANSFWFTMGAIMQQGSEIAPTSTSTRVLAGAWWFFCLIIVSSYTANLAAFLTVETAVKEVTGIADLYNQTKIKYGFKKGGSTYTYFKSSENEMFRALAEQMNEKGWEKYFVSSNEEGINLARTEKYAFIMESPTIDYTEYRICNLTMAGDEIDQKSYAIAFREGFEYHNQISRSISELQEKLVIKELYEKWWRQKGRQCFDSDSNNAEAMNLDQLSGVFLVLGVGILFSCGMTMWEFYQGLKSASKDGDVKLRNVFSEEVKFITKAKSSKPAFKKNKSIDSNTSNLSDNFSINSTTTTQA